MIVPENPKKLRRVLVQVTWMGEVELGWLGFGKPEEGWRRGCAQVQQWGLDYRLPEEAREHFKYPG